MSKVLKHEGTHNRKNHTEFANVTESLTERPCKNYDSKKSGPNRVRPNHDIDRRVARPLGKRGAVTKSSGEVKPKIKKEAEKESNNEACKKRAVEILKRSKDEPKREIKVEMPDKNQSRGFMPSDIIKGKIIDKAVRQHAGSLTGISYVV